MIKRFLYIIFIILTAFLYTNVNAINNNLQNIKKEDLLKKIDQMIIIGFNGDSLLNNKKETDISKILKKTNVGGVILFEKNIKNKKQLQKLIKDLQTNSKTRLFISIDEEGGYVSRLKNKYGFTNQIDTFFNLAKLPNDELYDKFYNHGKYIKELGININFSPVVDLAINENNTIIYKYERSFSSSSDIVIDKSKIAVDAYQKSKILTSLKHYPGHGNSIGDTHKGFVNITETYTKEEEDPYKILCKNTKVPFVMVGHLIDDNIDKKYPASLSANFISKLRNICPDQLIISDDYDMGAIKQNFSLREIVINSINSGVNVLLFSGYIDKYDKDFIFKIREEIYNSVLKNEIDINNINNSYQKIINYKKSYNVL